MLRNASKSGFLIPTRDRTIALAVSSSPVSFECVESRESRAREILGKAAFGGNWQQTKSNWNAESEYVEILDVCAGLPFALGIAVRGLHIDYEGSRDGEGRKDPSFAVRNYSGWLKKNSLWYVQRANPAYHRGGLKYVVDASLKSCEA